MDYKTLILEKLEEFCNEFPEMTMGEIFYSITTPLRAQDNFNERLLNLEDSKVYTYIETAINKEYEEAR